MSLRLPLEPLSNATVKLHKISELARGFFEPLSEEIVCASLITFCGG